VPALLLMAGTAYPVIYFVLCALCSELIRAEEAWLLDMEESMREGHA